MRGPMSDFDPYLTLWDIYVAIGCDPDGDTGPGSMIAGMGHDGFARMVLDEVREFRQDYEDALEGL